MNNTIHNANVVLQVMVSRYRILIYLPVPMFILIANKQLNVPKVDLLH